MINAVRPDSLEVPLSQNAKINTFNGRSDTLCLQKFVQHESVQMHNKCRLDGGHHFESPFFTKGISDGKHLFTNKVIAVHENLGIRMIRSTGETKGIKGESHRNFQTGGLKIA